MRPARLLRHTVDPRASLVGLPLAATFAVLNAMWYELMEDDAVRHDKLDKP